MDGKKIISKLKRLNEIQSMKDVTQLTHTLFPGSHCPLMGAALVAKGIKDCMIMVIGTDECAYYTKSLTLNKDWGGIKGRCVSVIVDNHDVTFGSDKTTEVAFDEMFHEYHPTCVFLVTTCVIEIIGDDMDAVAENLTNKYNIPVLAVHTEHFKCQDHMPGVERTMTTCINMMEPHEKDDSVNILGQRLGSFYNTELYQVLTNANIELGLMLPSNCTVEDIKKASKAKVNVVVHETALPLAKKMKQQFGVPYVRFERFSFPNNIMNCYKTLFDYLEKKVPSEVMERYDEVTALIYNNKQNLTDISYIYGNTSFVNFEVNSFMVSLGMKPLLIQISRFEENDEVWKNHLLEKENPYVTKSANITPLQYVYDELQPNLYLGHEYATRLKAKGIAMVAIDGANDMLGFDAAEGLVKGLVHSAQLSKQYREEKSHGTM
ncbi:hypothetical protein AN639_04700 [Candidatus Epulonipiscium fishelsonii]|uniref:Uncharacterized protein n=1 Tax=Candidatus Epulonipiscium fishelsonii TaxID=77094 RepID=A0ACC8XDF8_9FIRM|nr:hypothetical protein AN639_04700 [Epulopiscium sp. SCG-B05WGA-EpuloA1]ONI40778.1 hypothetical protein AN396_05005 [Epulopiscium sp. SCG-B11WGA-EpuloA1]